MSKNYKTIKFTLDSETIESIKSLISLPENIDFSYFVKAMFINRCIEKHYLDEFGMPIQLPKLDFSSIDFPSIPFMNNEPFISANDIREVVNEK